MKRVIAFLLLAMVLCFVGCSAPSEERTTLEQKEALNVYDDENISVDFIKASDSIVAGNFDLYLKVQNKTDKSITVSLKDVTINDSMVQVGSGVPCNLIAGASRTHGWFGRLDLAGVTSADEINKITFKVWLVDEEYNTIMTTEDLEVIK